jgi:heptose-I-phosphate ethanolaminephosphotransferase
MYTVPFIAYASPKWKQTHDWNFESIHDRPYTSSNLIHTWAQLAGLSFDELDTTKSLVSLDFKARPRLIGDPYAPKGLSDFAHMEKAASQPGAMPEVVQK